MREYFIPRVRAVRVMPWVAAIVCLALFASSPPYAQQDDSDEGDASTPESSSASEEEEEVEVRVDENVFVPSEEISQDNAVAFPVDI